MRGRRAAGRATRARRVGARTHARRTRRAPRTTGGSRGCTARGRPPASEPTLRPGRCSTPRERTHATAAAAAAAAARSKRGCAGRGGRRCAWATKRGCFAKTTRRGYIVPSVQIPTTPARPGKTHASARRLQTHHAQKRTRTPTAPRAATPPATKTQGCARRPTASADGSKTIRHAGFPSYFYRQYWSRRQLLSFQVLMDLGVLSCV